MSDYPTNLTEKQWQVIKNIVEPQERNRKSSIREIVNGIFYVNKSGCQWRMLPSDFAPWQTAYYYFRKWKLEGVWEELLNVLHAKARKSVGNKCCALFFVHFMFDYALFFVQNLLKVSSGGHIGILSRLFLALFPPSPQVTDAVCYKKALGFPGVSSLTLCRLTHRLG